MGRVTVNSGYRSLERQKEIEEAAARTHSDHLPPPDWKWPYACHRYGHIYDMGWPRCQVCGLPIELAEPDYAERYWSSSRPVHDVVEQDSPAMKAPG